MISLLYNHINLRMYVFLLPLNEPFQPDSSPESTILHQLFLTVAQNRQTKRWLQTPTTLWKSVCLILSQKCKLTVAYPAQCYLICLRPRRLPNISSQWESLIFSWRNKSQIMDTSQTYLQNDNYLQSV